MPDVITEMIDSWSDEQVRHAMLVHFPIVLSVLGVPLALLAVLFSKRSAMRWAVVAAYVLFVAGAWMAMGSGNEAEGGAGADISPAAAEHLDTHKELGSYAYLFGAGVAVLFALSALPKGLMRHGAGAAGLLLAGYTAYWVAATAHHGGQLVYAYGIGAGEPASLNNDDSDPGSADGAGDAGNAPSAGDPRLVFFEQTVRPILRERCWGCHNPARASRSGELNLTTMSGILQGGKSGNPAIVPGHVDSGELLTAISYEDDFLQMPPPRKGGKLPDEAIAALRQWVADGAVWSDAAKPDWVDQQDGEAGEPG